MSKSTPEHTSSTPKKPSLGSLVKDSDYAIRRYGVPLALLELEYLYAKSKGTQTANNPLGLLAYGTEIQSQGRGVYASPEACYECYAIKVMYGKDSIAGKTIDEILALDRFEHLNEINTNTISE